MTAMTCTDVSQVIQVNCCVLCHLAQLQGPMLSLALPHGISAIDPGWTRSGGSVIDCYANTMLQPSSECDCPAIFDNMAAAMPYIFADLK